MRLSLLAASLIIAAIAAPSEPAFAEKRIALVIGNGAYRHATPLPNPRNDAEDVAAALRRVGFETIVGTDLDRNGMEDNIIRFSRQARGADVAAFYYSGHAMQFVGVNYLVPIDARLTDESDLRRLTRVDEIVQDLQQAKNVRMLVLDACRDNPLAEQLKRSLGLTRSASMPRGLAKIDSPQGMIVAFSTQSGHTAEDGQGRNSPYTAAFLKHIETAEEIGTVFRRVTQDVYKTTGNTQLPELSLSLIGEVYLNGRIEVTLNPAQPAGPVAPADPELAMRRDYEFAERAGTREGWDLFLSRYPAGFYADLARTQRSKIAALEKVERPADTIDASPGSERTCGDEKKLRSTSGDKPTTVAIVNQRQTQIRVYWLDYGGQRKLYGTLKPGETHTQPTFVTHPWVVADANDRCLTIYLPAAQNTRHVLR